MTHKTMDELEGGLDTVRRAPKNEGLLRMIVRRPAENAREIVEKGTLDVDEGLVGDNWKTRGSSSTPDKKAHPEMQINLMNSRMAALLSEKEASQALAGDQLFVDLDLSETNVPPKTRLVIGGAILEVTAVPHRGCKKFKERFGLDALKLVNSELGRTLHLRGINAKVVQSGAIRVGDSVSKQEPH